MEMAYVGVRTRARALAMAAAASSGTAKRRKVGNGELKFSSSLVHLRNPCRVIVSTENSVPPATSRDAEQRMVSKRRCSSPCSDHGSASCCSSNAPSDLAEERSETVDLEDDNAQLETSTCGFVCKEMKAMTSSSSEFQAESDNLESTVRPSKADSGRRPSSEKMPSEAELEEFFTAAERDLQKRFKEKYNYDVVKDMPLEGRYEWVRLKP